MPLLPSGPPSVTESTPFLNDSRLPPPGGLCIFSRRSGGRPGVTARKLQNVALVRKQQESFVMIGECSLLLLVSSGRDFPMVMTQQDSRSGAL